MAQLARTSAALLLICLATAASASARPGDVDSTFGDGGEATFIVPGHDLYFAGTVQQPDGKLIVSAVRPNPGGKPATVMLVRYTRDGALDRSFGGGDGVVNTPLSGLDAGPIVDDRGRILVSGWRFLEEPGQLQVVLRYGPDGRVDRSYGNDGVDGIRGQAVGLDPTHGILDSDGRLVLVGYSNGGRHGSHWALARRLPDGGPDPSFGDGGWVATDHFVNGDIARVAEQPDGKLMILGSIVDVFTNPVHYEWVLGRYDRDGRLDPSFGDDGLQHLGEGPPAGGPYPDLMLRPDGRMILSGAARREDDAAFAVSRVGPDGKLDPSFGNGGATLVPRTASGRYQWGQTAHVVAQSDGRIAAAGGVIVTDSNEVDVPRDELRGIWTVARMLPDGGLDPDFGDGGTTTSARGANYQMASDLFRAPDGKLVVAGTAGVCGRPTPTLVRYHAENADAGVPEGGPAMRTCAPTVVLESDGDVPVPTQCPFLEETCDGTAVVQVAGRELRRAGSVRVGKKSFRLGGGSTRAVKVRAKSSVRRTLRKRRSVLATVVYTARDADGNRRVTRRALRLRVKR